MLFGFKNPTSGDTLNYHIEGWAKRSKTHAALIWFDARACWIARPSADDKVKL